jgi:uncharacterized LabA/DUF88 family protein
MTKVVFVIDGWFMRKRIYKLKTFYYNGKNIRRYCLSLLKPDQVVYRIFYYDTEPLSQKGHNPITKKMIDFSITPVAVTQNKLLDSIRSTPNFALRLGRTLWADNAWMLKDGILGSLLEKKCTIDDLMEGDVIPLIRQKAVDMKMGLDIASIATKRLADTLIIITGDADVVPALKLARKEGMQVGIDPLYNFIDPELREHVDFICSRAKEKLP